MRQKEKKIRARLETSSFRDPGGFVFYLDGQPYRQINQKSKQNFDLLTNSGLYQDLAGKGLIASHAEVSNKFAVTKDAYKIIKPQIIPFISYPYEWSFDQLKDAALTTLEIQEIALSYNMSLKDASAYNIQFIGYRPIFIDTLSFEKYREGQTWTGYRQFCQHFLAPLALMSKKDPRTNLILRDFIDGIPLDLTSQLLPNATKFDLSLLTHLHLHSLNQKRMAEKKINKSKYRMTRFQMLSLIGNLKSTIEKLKMNHFKTEWQEYYSFTNYSDKAAEQKELLLKNFLNQARPKFVLDLGANDGRFSQIACQNGAYTIACDIDPLAIEKSYLEAKRNKNSRLLPLIIDLTNPSPSLGWASVERKSFNQRAKVDCVVALALIHHLAISNNLPLPMIAEYFAGLGDNLIIEFVPKEDSNVKILLQNREDIFTEYSKEGFEKAFQLFFNILGRENINESKRILYLMKRK